MRRTAVLGGADRGKVAIWPVAEIEVARMRGIGNHWRSVGVPLAEQSKPIRSYVIHFRAQSLVELMLDSKSKVPYFGILQMCRDRAHAAETAASWRNCAQSGV